MKTILLSLSCSAALAAACASSSLQDNPEAGADASATPTADAGASPTDDGADAGDPGASDDIYGTLVPRSDSYWVDGPRILRGHDEVVLRGINWFGLETTENAPHGLWSGRSIDDFVQQLAGLGFTALRVPVARPSIQPGFAAASWAQHGDVDTGRELLEELLTSAGTHGVRVLLDIHTCDPAIGGGAAAGPEACQGYSRQDWLDDLRALAALAATHTNVVGIDLFNEPHGPTWSEWRALAALGAEAVLRENPRVLVFVEGVGAASPAGGYQPFWGENLTHAGAEPVAAPTSRLVYSPHVYGPGVFAQSYFADPDFPANMPAIWDAHFGYLAPTTALAIGEFGGHYTDSDRVWQDALVDYMLARPLRHFFYWSLNPNSGDTGGLLGDDWQTVNPDKLALLQRLGL